MWKVLGWEPDLVKYDLSVIVQVTGKYVVVMPSLKRIFPLPRMTAAG